MTVIPGGLACLPGRVGSTLEPAVVYGEWAGDLTLEALGSNTRTGNSTAPEGQKKSLLFYSETVSTFQKLPCWSLFSEQRWHWGVPGNLLMAHFQEERGRSTKGPDSQAH